MIRFLQEEGAPTFIYSLAILITSILAHVWILIVYQYEGVERGHKAWWRISHQMVPIGREHERGSWTQSESINFVARHSPDDIIINIIRWSPPYLHRRAVCELSPASNKQYTPPSTATINKPLSVWELCCVVPSPFTSAPSFIQQSTVHHSRIL